MPIAAPHACPAVSNATQHWPCRASSLFHAYGRVRPLMPCPAEENGKMFNLGGYIYIGLVVLCRLNPSDVEFVFTSCAAFNCWVEPRCTVGNVTKTTVSLKQAGGNSSCWHRLYYFGIGWGGTDKPSQKPPVAPTSIENLFDPKDFTKRGTWYYDRAAGTITYLPRAGETVATLEATATTTGTEMLLDLENTKNLVWEGTRFQYATQLHTSGPKGFVDTQSGYLYRDGEPGTNIHISSSSNISFKNCDFSHFGAVYTLGADGGSQNVVVSNCTFTDCSGGAIKLGSSGERGGPAPSTNTSVADQDRGFLVSDCLMEDTTIEYGSANAIFGGYVADTTLAHNTITGTSYSAICLGWGWGENSYMRNVHAMNNSIVSPMRRLADGGGLYTNTPCVNCNVSGNVFENDNIEYGCLYHDGGSSGWWDYDNVFNHVHTPTVFGHGSCTDIIVDRVWANDSSTPHLQGAVNAGLADVNGTCVAPAFHYSPKGKPWSAWPAPAAAIVANAGRRSGALPEPVAPAISPPVPAKSAPSTSCHRFAMMPCVGGKAAQRWTLSPGATPTNGKLTVVRSAVLTNPSNATSNSCWEANFMFSHSVDACSQHNGAVECANGCMPLPSDSNTPAPSCDRAGAWTFMPNGTIINAQPAAINHDGTKRIFNLCLTVSSRALLCSTLRRIG